MQKTNSNKVQFTVTADDKKALERAINYVNLQSGSDYELINHESHEVGLGTIQVSRDKIQPEFLFMMGLRYHTICKPLKINFSAYDDDE